MNHGYRLKAKPKTDVIEDDSLKIFNNLVNFSRLDFINQGGKVVNYDGQVKLMDMARRTEVVALRGQDVAAYTKYQIKGTTQKTQSYSFSIEDLSAYALEGKPVFLFFINIPQRIVYYEVVNKKYIQHVLGLDLQNTGKQKTKAIKFHKEFTGDTTPLLFDFIDCENIGSQLPQTPPEPEDATQKEVADHKKIVGAGNSEMVFDIEAFLFLFPLEDRDTASKTRILVKLELEEDDFDFYIRDMLKKGIIISAGGRLLVKDVKVAKYFLSELIDRKGVQFVYE